MNDKIHEKWLVTGGCGFIGTSLINYIISKNTNVNIRVLDNFSVGSEEDLKKVSSMLNADKDEKKVVLSKGDILDNALCLDLSKDVDCIVHLAASTGVGESVENPRTDLNSNVIGTFNMLEAARKNGVKQFVFASSGAPAGEIDPPIHEEIAPHPVSPYGASKLSGEGYCSAYARTFGINTSILRFGNVYGPRSKNKSSIIAKFIKNVLNDLTCEIYGDGTQTRDYIFVNDLVDAIIKASVLDQGGEIFQIATGNELSVLELADILVLIFNEFGYDMKIKHSEKRIGDVKRNYSDISKAKNILCWESSTDIQTGLRMTINNLIAST